MKPQLLTAATVIASIASLAAKEQSQQLQRPNIIWISAEDTSATRWSCYGDPIPHMPVVDSLANIGVRYTNTFATAAISAPVRAGIISGMYQTSIGCHPMTTESYMRAEVDGALGYTAVPAHYIKAFTEYLRAAGYYCTNRGKTHYQFSFKEEVPKSIWDDQSGSAHFKNRPDKSQPFFAVYNSNATHGNKGLSDKSGFKCNLNDIIVPPYYIDNENARKEMANHYDNMTLFDDYVARLLNDLREDGSLDNTIIFIWSDHGSGMPRGKRWLYDSGTHIPLIVIYPNSTKGSVCEELVSTVDFGPTVLSLAGVPVPTHMEGRPFLGEQKAESRKYVYSAKDREDENYDMIRSVRSDRYLYIRNFYTIKPYSSFLRSRNNSKMMSDLYRASIEGTLTEAQRPFMAATRPPEELYDVVKDPHNIHNLATDPKYKKVLESMRAEQERWTEETGDLGHQTEDELYRRFFPDGKSMVTCTPRYTINEPGSSFRMTHDGGKGVQTIKSPAEFSLACSTQGASMVYRVAKKGESMPKRWMLLSGPVRLDRGEYQIEARAQRYGYKESEPLLFELKVE
ncbi:MAG: sulfatase [Rikenellaceae bacterium]